MNQNKSAYFWGLLLIALGILIAGNAFDLWHFDIFFDGWWTLFIIIPSLVSLFGNSNKTPAIIGLVIGIYLLLNAQDIIPGDVAGKLLLPLILVLIGLSILFRHSGQKNPAATSGTGDSWIAIFGGQNIVWPAEPCEGGNITAVFGGVELDLRAATIEEDIIITALAVFGGVEIYVPANVNVAVNATPIFGGVENNVRRTADPEQPTITLQATCVFGGIEIR